MTSAKKSRELLPEKIYDVLLNLRTAAKLTIHFKDGRVVQGALIFNPFKGTGRLINIEQEQSVDFSVDEHPRRDTTVEKLAGLKVLHPEIEGFSITAGNASGIVDGAASIVVTTDERARADGLDVMATIRGWSYVGVDPKEMGLGPVPAIRNLLEKASLGTDDVDYFEINEAFSAQYLGCEKELGLDRERCNVNGGAISLGHPLGATGTRLILTLCYQLRRSGKRYGVGSACIGGGQGIAMLIENTAG